MFQKFKVIFKLFSLFFLFVTSCQTDPSHEYPQHLIVVDAGSSGTRLHIFRYLSDDNKTAIDHQQITELFKDKTTPGISSFVHNLSALESNLSPLFDAAKAKLKEESVDIKTVPLFFYSTAGMRLLAAHEQQSIYHEVHKTLNKYEFDVKEIKTIEGKMEGVYAWLTVNYLSQSFNQQKTTGILEMGGASTQIAFEKIDEGTESPCQDIETTSCLHINGKMHQVFSVSFLGLGQNTALKFINTMQNADVCYPKGYPNIQNTKGFDFDQCANLYQHMLDATSVKSVVQSHAKNMNFFALSSFVYATDFFQVPQPIKKDEFKNAIKEKCAADWNTLQTACEQDITCKENFSQYLHTYCALGVYFNTLIYEPYYKINDQDYLQSQMTIHGVEPDWPLGVVVDYKFKKN